MGNSGWSNEQPNSLVLPPDALPTEPRIVIGDELPPNIAHLTAAILFYALNNAGELVAHYYGIAPGDVFGATIERGFFPTSTTDPAFTQVLDKYQYDSDLSTQPIYIINAFRTIFEGLGLNQEVAFFVDYDISGDSASTFEWAGPVELSQGKILSDSGETRTTAGYTPTTIVPTDLTGGSVSVVTRRASAKWEADWTADMMSTLAGAFTNVVNLDINGTTGFPQAIWNPANVAIGARATVGQSYGGILGGAGFYTFKLQGSRQSGAGQGIINASHTTLNVRIYE